MASLPRGFATRKRGASRYMTLVTETAEPALVVIAQSFYHNWRAYVDDRPTPLLRANYAFQTLQVPAGHRQVTLVYEDHAFYCGALISLVSAVAGVVIWLRGRQRAAGYSVDLGARTGRC